MSTKVRHEPVHLTLAVPDGDALLAWAADAQKRQAGAPRSFPFFITVIFRPYLRRPDC